MTTGHQDIEITRKLVETLGELDQFGHESPAVQILETHISYVLLTGSFAYKIKKPVDLGFVDFSSLDKRRFYCEEEVRLNKRMAPDLYLGVTPITGTIDLPKLDGTGEVIEYAVKMRQFEQDHQLDRYLKQAEILPDQLDRFAADIAEFHGGLKPIAYSSRFATYESIANHALDNFMFCESCTETIDQRETLKTLKEWTQESLQKNKSHFAQRKRDGFVRECHGDLHLGNLTLLDGRVVAFDCLEFNADLRCIDTICEIAFFLMDIDYHNRSHQGRQFLNKYLEALGDYEGLRLLRHYLTYRAMVRAKVACIKLQQLSDNAGASNDIRAEFDRHIILAKHYTKPVSDTPIIITHGFSGCGKTYVTEKLIAVTNMVRIRSDIERKRLAGLSGRQSSHSETGQDLYTKAASQNVYQRLYELARVIIDAGYPVIVDATFLRSDDRHMFQELAKNLSVPYVILEITASPATLKQRIERRRKSETDASEATLDVLKFQQGNAESLAEEEHRFCLTIDSETNVDFNSIWKSILMICRATQD